MGNASSVRTEGAPVNGDAKSGGGGGGLDASEQASRGIIGLERERKVVRLTYFDSNFRSELIRLTLAAGAVDFEDRRIQHTEWQELKPKTPLGGLPILEYGDQMYGQSSSIARFAAKLAKLEGSTAEKQMRADMVVDNYWDLLTNRVVKALFEKDEEAKAKLVEGLLSTDFPKFFSFCDMLVMELAGDFINGDEMTYADIAVMDLVYRLRDSGDKFFGSIGSDDQRREVTEKYPLMGQLTKRVLENSGIQRYLKNLKDRKTNGEE